MKIPKDILFRLLFLSAVIFCIGLEDYTNYNNPKCISELTSEQNSNNNNLVLHFDSFEDDHINQVIVSDFFTEQIIVIPLSNELFLFNEFTFSNWQPPKYC